MPTSILVWRRNERSFHRALSGSADADEAAALARIALGGLNGGGWTFGALCEWLAEIGSESEAPARAAGWLAGWLAEGILRALEPDRT